MLEVRFHGRAGQGIVSAAEILAEAAAMEGKRSQAFPFFGSEKRGPPVTSYCRIDEKAITIHEEIQEPDIIVVAEPTVMKEIRVEEGLKPNGMIIVNSTGKPEELGLDSKHVFCVNGTEIAVKHLGKPITNTVMLGALCKITGIVKLESIKKAIQKSFCEKFWEANINAVQECFDATEQAVVPELIVEKKPFKKTVMVLKIPFSRPGTSIENKTGSWRAAFFAKRLAKNTGEKTC